MKSFLVNSTFFGVFITILTFEIGQWLKKKTKLTICNPILIAVITIIVCLTCLHIDYDTYSAGAKYISYLLTPATVCLAVPLYEQFELLKKNVKAVLAGIISGILTSMTTVWILATLFQLNHQQYVTLLPKSITTAIGMGISEELGGFVTITVAVIVSTGILGNILSDTVLKVFHIKEPIAKGVAIGAASHAIGTSRAMEMGAVEGAMSSLSLAVSGLLSVLAAMLYANFL